MQHQHTSAYSLALKTTFHCLIGCGIGEVAGMIISMAINLTTINSIVLSVLLGFFAALALAVPPLKKAGFDTTAAIKTVLITEGVSIAVMESFEVITQLSIPGVMQAQIHDAIFWVGMIVSLVVGFIAAFPVNYFMLKKGIRHHH